ncbi:MAG: hypothetical protein J6T56_01805 [Bacteroidales bacterium]|nr:hypothetical protein [Bacteroidales bacterium]MBP5613153.1 hypothetical protein [Bacteroidales bacterium]
MWQKTSLYFLFILSLSISCSSTHTDENENTSDTTFYGDNMDEAKSSSTVSANIIDNKILFIRSFYSEYIYETCTEDGSIPNMENVGKIEEKYCSKELLTKINGLDYDPFLKAQDCDVEWLNNLDIKADTKDENWFTVSYSYTDYLNNKQNISIRLKIVPTDNHYQIIDIE